MTSPTTNKVTLKVGPIQKWLWVLLLSVNLFILFADIFLNHHGWLPYPSLRRFLNITREDSLGNWFSSTLILFTSLMLWAITVVHAHDAQIRRARVWSWFLIASFFSYMAVDDATKFHERLATAIKDFSERSPANVASGMWTQWLDMFPSYLWQLFLMPIFATMGIYMFYFLRREFKRRRLFAYIFLALSCYAVAVGLDFVEGMKSFPLQVWAQAWGLATENLVHYFKAVEESLENLGTIFFLMAFMGHLFAMSSHISISLRKP